MAGFYRIEPSCQIPGLEGIYQGIFGRIKDGSFVEVGAFDGRTYSNTYGLTEIGWKGLYIEPMPELYERCLGNHKNHPNIRTIQALISNVNGLYETIYTSGELNTTSLDELAAINVNPNSSKIMRTNTLDDVLYDYDGRSEVYQKIDLLVIDVEGAELKVLSGAYFTLHYRQPTLIIIETHEYHENEKMRFNSFAIRETLGKHGYRNIYSDAINSIYYLV